MDMSQELYVKDDQNLEANLIDHAVNKSSSVPEKKNYIRWFRVSVCVIFFLFSQKLVTTLGRVYYENGGQSEYLATFFQVPGFPVILLFRYFSRIRQSTIFKQSPSFTILASVSMSTGLLVSASAYLSTFGVLYLPVFTFSLILLLQFAFSYFLNSQMFTPFIVNSLLLTVTSTVLMVNTKLQNTSNVSSVPYVIGFICTIGASAGIGLLLSLLQLLFRKVFKKHTSSAVMDMVAYHSLWTSCVVLIGLYATGVLETLQTEMRNYKLGQVSYVLTLALVAISWQVYTVRKVEFIFESCFIIFSNTKTAVGLLMVPVVALIFFYNKMDASKIFSISFSLWGFLSFSYQYYLDENKTSHTNPVKEDTQT